MSTPPYDQLPNNPYSDRPAIDLTKCKYPENAVWGVGAWGMFPFLVMVFERWPELSVGDYYGLRIRDLSKPIASDTVKFPGDRKNYSLLVAGELVPEGESDVLGRVVRTGSLQESRSDTVRWLFKKTIPGGFDRKVWEPWHSELTMWLEKARTGEPIPEGSIIDPTVIEDGVVYAIKVYQNARKNDVVTGNWGGIDFTHIVSPQEAAGKVIRVPVPDEVIARANQLGRLYAVFTVEDLVGNRPGGNYRYSKPYGVNMELDLTLRDAPIHFVNSVEANHVNLDTESDAKITLQVSLKREKVKPSPPKQVFVFLDIPLPDGSTRTESLAPFPDRNVTVETVSIPNAIVKELSGSFYRARFEVRSASGALLEMSASTPVSVTGTATRMPAPTIRAMEGVFIPANKDAILDRPAYKPFNKNWRETLEILQGESGSGGQRFTRSRLAGLEIREYYLEKEELKPFENKGLLSITYRSDNGQGNSSSVRVSEELQAQIGDREEVLPQAIVKVAQGSNIDPDHVKGREVLFSFPYFGTKVGNIVHWAWVGVTADGSVSGSFEIDAATAGPNLMDLFLSIDKDVLLKSLGGAVSLSYSVEEKGPPRTFESSKIADFNIGRLVEFKKFSILEADPQFQDRVYAKDLLNGAHLRVELNIPVTSGIFNFSWKGAHGISIQDVQVQVNAATNSATARILPETIALAIRDTGNDITAKCIFSSGQASYDAGTLNFRLMPPDDLPKSTLNGETAPILSLLSLDADVTHLILPQWSLMQKNQRIWMDLTGTLATGKVYKKQIYLGDKITDEQVAKGVVNDISTEELRGLQANSLLSITPRVSFAQQDDIASSVPFPPREYRIQTVPVTLPAPAFDNKPGATLTIAPLGYVQGASVAVAYPGMTTAQVITFEWIFPNGTVATIPVQNGASGGRVDFAISAQIIAQSVSKIITLRYSIKSGTKTIWSDTQVLTVGPLPVANLPQARINNLPDGALLDLRNISGPLTLSLPAWMSIFVGQIVWITIRSRGVLPLAVLTAYPVKEADIKSGLVNIPVSREWLELAANDEPLSVSCKVALDGSVNEGDAIPLRETAYILKVYDFVTLGNVPVQYVHSIGEYFSNQFLNVTFFQKAHNIDYVDYRSDSTNGLAIYNYTGYSNPNLFNAYNLVTNRVVRRIVFDLRGGNITFVNPSITFMFYSAAGSLVAQRAFNLPSIQYYGNRRFTVDTGSILNLKTVYVKANCAFWVDRIRLY